MSLLGLALRSLAGRPLAGLLTALTVALGAALVVGLLALRASTRRSFLDAAQGFDAVLGPTDGSRLDTILSALFFLGDAKGTLPWKAYEDVQKDPRVAVAVPIAMGDSFRGFPVVGTTDALLTTLSGPDRRTLDADLYGRLFRPERFEAVVGSVVAAETGLSIGDRFRVLHGIDNPTHEHPEEWEVVGLLRPSGAPADRAIFIPLDTFYAIGGHVEGAEQLAERRGEEANAQHTLGLSAVGVRLVGPGLRLSWIAEMRQDRDDLDVAQPLDEIVQLLSLIGSVDQAFELLAWVVVVVSGLGILVGLYNTIHGRRREIAILRAVGARPWHVFAVVLLEAVLLVLVGGIVGILLGHGAVALAAPDLLVSYGIRADVSLGPRDLLVLLGLLGIGVLAGALPAWRALRTPVAANLAPGEA